MSSFTKVAVLLAALAALTNPHTDGFLSAYQRKRFGFIGAAADHIGQQLGVVEKEWSQNYYLCTTIFYREQWHVGAFGTFIELPKVDATHAHLVDFGTFGVVQIPMLDDFIWSPDFLALAMIFCWFLWKLMPTFMWNNFILSKANLQRGKIWTPLTAIFSHIHLPHLLVNVTSMLCLVGDFRQDEFYEIFLVTGIVSGLISTLSRGVLFGLPETETLGASGAVFGLLAKLMANNPHWQLQFLGRNFTPAQYLWLRLGIDSIISYSSGGMDILAHLSGAMIGYNYDAARMYFVRFLYNTRSFF